MGAANRRGLVIFLTGLPGAGAPAGFPSGQLHYARARAGLLSEFTGVSDYEPPEDADLAIDTQGCTPQEAAETLVARLRADGFLE